MRALPGSGAETRAPRALTRDEMAGEQRRRLIEATAELVGEHGYPGFRVEELLSRAQVGLPTVRKHFGDKRGCYLALFGLIAAHPDVARACLIEPFAAGEAAIAGRWTLPRQCARRGCARRGS